MFFDHEKSQVPSSISHTQSIHSSIAKKKKKIQRNCVQKGKKQSFYRYNSIGMSAEKTFVRLNKKNETHKIRGASRMWFNFFSSPFAPFFIYSCCAEKSPSWKEKFFFLLQINYRWCYAFFLSSVPSLLFALSNVVTRGLSWWNVSHLLIWLKFYFALGFLTCNLQCRVTWDWNSSSGSAAVNLNL